MGTWEADTSIETFWGRFVKRRGRGREWIVGVVMRGKIEQFRGIQHNLQARILGRCYCYGSREVTTGFKWINAPEIPNPVQVKPTNRSRLQAIWTIGASRKPRDVAFHARYKVGEHGRGRIEGRKGASANERVGGCRSRNGRAGQTAGVNSHARNVSRPPECDGISGGEPW